MRAYNRLRIVRLSLSLSELDQRSSIRASGAAARPFVRPELAASIQNRTGEPKNVARPGLPTGQPTYFRCVIPKAPPPAPSVHRHPDSGLDDRPYIELATALGLDRGFRG